MKGEGQGQCGEAIERAGRAGILLRWVGTVGIATIAVMRCAVFFAPQVVFDVDPAFDPERLGGLGPAGSLWLDVVLFLLCGCGLIGEALARKGIDRGLVLLAVIPLPVVLWHGMDDAGDLWRGATWVAAAAACVTAAHLGRDRVLRTVLIMCLVGVAAVVLVRGAANVTYEYEDTVRQFEQRRESIFEEKGWEPDSSSAQIFERRLRQRQPTGWFVTTNVFGSLAAFALITWVGLAIGAARARLESGWTALMGLAGLAAGVGLTMTGSKGAMLACAGGVVLLLAPLVLRWMRRWMGRWGPVIAVVFVVGALVGVVVRGAVLPEGFAGEKSLLFRWHYMQASAGIAVEHPLTGVGADGFGDGYLRHRPARNPEEVRSAHSVFWDWMCGLGVSGAAWVVMVLVLVWRAGGKLGLREEPDEEVMQIGALPAVVSVLCVALLGLLPALLCEVHTLDALGIGVRVLGVGAFVLFAMMSGHVVARAERGVVDAALGAAAVAIVIHGQIEMTFILPGSAVWAMGVVGLAGGARGRGVNWTGIAGGAVAVAAAVWLIVVGALPMTRMEGQMVGAAAPLWPIAEARRDLHTWLQDARAEYREAAVERLAGSMRSLGAADVAAKLAANGQASRGVVEQIAGVLRAAEGERRPVAAAALAGAHETMPTAQAPLLAAAEQLELAQRLERVERRVALLEGALGYLEYWLQRERWSAAAVPACQINVLLARLTGEARYEDQAVALAERITAADRNGLGGWRLLGDVLWEFGRRAEAAGAYERALEVNADFELDPLKQLPEDEVERIEGRIAEERG